MSCEHLKPLVAKLHEAASALQAADEPSIEDLHTVIEAAHLLLNEMAEDEPEFEHEADLGPNESNVQVRPGQFAVMKHSEVTAAGLKVPTVSMASVPSKHVFESVDEALEAVEALGLAEYIAEDDSVVIVHVLNDDESRIIYEIQG